MKADIKGALTHINRSWKVFEYNGKPMTKDQVRKVLEYGLNKGYETTDDYQDGEIGLILNAP